ncbi:hypothetical protein AFLA70_822g000081 [Aspergillus flavus AF70]|nr:hypothetical protein AFLA70_822g000081 [Aspergillus flavus AF70]
MRNHWRTIHGWSQDPVSRIPWSQTPFCKTFQEQVTWMVSQLMVRGTHTPIETL